MVIRTERHLHHQALSIVIAATCCLLSATQVRAQVFTPGRVAVLEYTWSGSSAFTGGPLTIREFDTNGVPGAVVSVPTTGPDAMVNCFNGNVGASMTRTPSGDKLVFTGFVSTAPVGSQTLNGTSSSVVQRAIGTVDAAGSFDRPVTTSTQFNASTLYAASSDGTNYWAGGANSGVCNLGTGAPAVVNADVPYTMAMHYVNGNLLTLGNNNIIYQVGTGSPVVPAAQTIVMTSSGGTFDFQMSPSGTVCYTAHTNAVRKWVLSGGTWTNVYTFTATSTWLVRIAVDFSGPQPVIYGVHNIPNKLIKWVDAGAPSTEILLATAGGNTNWYGLSFTPTSCVGGACDDGNPNTVSDTYAPGCVCTGRSVRVAAKVLLSGPLPVGSGQMNDGLRTLADFPLVEPYTALGLPPAAGSGTIVPAVLAVTGSNAIVDWVLVELRQAGSPTIVTTRRAALLQRDGDVVDLDGTSAVELPAEAANYHVVIRHRNHLGVMTASALALTEDAAVVDFTSAATSTYGTDASVTAGAFRALWPGDVAANGDVKYTGTSNDRDPVLTSIGGTLPTNTLIGYRLEDVNLDGVVKYTGSDNDRDPILITIGGSTPTIVREVQLP